MATLVSFHAHPDDEAIPTGGTLAKAAKDGHRVVLVVGTKGEHGEVEDGFLAAGESLAERRVQETHRSAEILGASRVEFLGYVDSGMMGTPENEAPNSFWQADIEEAAGRLAAILTDEDPDAFSNFGVTDDEITTEIDVTDFLEVKRASMRAHASQISESSFFLSMPD